VIALTERGDVRTAVLAMQAGAFDVLEKPVDPRELIERIESCFEHLQRRLCDLTASEAVAAPLAMRAERVSLDGRLTQRERQVLAGVAAGRTSREIALDLGISPKTVEKHRKHLMEKLEVDSLAALLKLYWDVGSTN
jgi:two-component system response regulator FixJ